MANQSVTVRVEPDLVPLTSDTDRKPRLPMPVIAPLPSNGLELHSAALCGSASCPPQELRMVRVGVAAVMGLSDLLVASTPDPLG